ncbi:MAG: hypothetical protein Q7T87_21970 [Polaromonas sp.]|nr:hypothetical protein [Polaromonas sp.]
MLSQTNKAGHQRYWEPLMSGIARFAGMLSPDTSYGAFKAEFVATMNRNSPVNNLAGPLVELHEENPVLAKVLDLRRAGVPRDVIVTMVGLQLETRPAHTPQLLEALAYFDAMPPEEWLRTAYGIELTQ